MSSQNSSFIQTSVGLSAIAVTAASTIMYKRWSKNRERETKEKESIVGAIPTVVAVEPKVYFVPNGYKKKNLKTPFKAWKSGPKSVRARIELPGVPQERVYLNLEEPGKLRFVASEDAAKMYGIAGQARTYVGTLFYDPQVLTLGAGGAPGYFFSVKDGVLCINFAIATEDSPIDDGSVVLVSGSGCGEFIHNPLVTNNLDRCEISTFGDNAFKVAIDAPGYNRVLNEGISGNSIRFLVVSDDEISKQGLIAVDMVTGYDKRNILIIVNNGIVWIIIPKLPNPVAVDPQE